MPRNRPHINVHIVGTRFVRLVIANDRQQVWTGEAWSDHREDALLYAHVEVVRQDVKMLKRRLRETEQE